MATYKVLQDIEAEDKFLGPLTLKQFIFGSITAILLYVSFLLVAKHAAFMLIIFLPVAIVSGFLAFPWGRDQPTEIWLLGKIRFFIKPRRRIWNQDGMQELVTITVPKKIEHALTNNLSQNEVKSRLKALADTIDSRGWAIKNVGVNLSAQSGYAIQDPASDRLIDISALPQEVPSVDIAATKDMFDYTQNPVAQHLDQMMQVATEEQHENVREKMDQARKAVPSTDSRSSSAHVAPAQDLWFAQNQSSATAPAAFQTQSTPATSAPLATAPKLTAQEEQALLAQLHPNKKGTAAYGHMKVIDPKGTGSSKQKGDVAQPHLDPANIELATNNDWNVATIARQAQREHGQEPPDEVEIKLR